MKYNKKYKKAIKLVDKRITKDISDKNWADKIIALKVWDIKAGQIK